MTHLLSFFKRIRADIERDLLIDLLSVPLIDFTEFDDPDVDEEQDEDEEGEDEDDEDEDEDDEEQRSEYFYLVNDEGWSIVSRDENPIPYFPFKIKAIFAPATQETIHNSKAKPSDYDPCDFDLSDEVFNSDSRLDFEASFNEIEITINDPDFHLTVTGFPENKKSYWKYRIFNRGRSVSYRTIITNPQDITIFEKKLIKLHFGNINILTQATPYRLNLRKLPLNEYKNHLIGLTGVIKDFRINIELGPWKIYLLVELLLLKEKWTLRAMNQGFSFIFIRRHLKHIPLYQKLLKPRRQYQLRRYFAN